jgi:hypothetical protein
VLVEDVLALHDGEGRRGLVRGAVPLGGGHRLLALLLVMCAVLALHDAGHRQEGAGKKLQVPS